MFGNSTTTASATSRPSLEQLEMVMQAVRAVARRQRLSPDDEDEFGQSVHLRLLKRNYDIFARCTDPGGLRTYLVVAVTRMFIDWQRGRLGRWRRSAQAARLGRFATILECLLSRDGCSADQAVQIVRGMKGSPTESTLALLVDQLPTHSPRRNAQPQRTDRHPSVEFSDPLETVLRVMETQRVRRALSDALQTLPAPDRRFISALYHKGQKVSTVAAALNVNPTVLYRRGNRILRHLRRALAGAGVSHPQNRFVRTSTSPAGAKKGGIQ